MNSKSLIQPMAHAHHTGGAPAGATDGATDAADPRDAIERYVWRLLGICIAVAPPLLAFVPVRPAPMEAPAAMARVAPEPEPVPALQLVDRRVVPPQAAAH